MFVAKVVGSGGRGTDDGSGGGDLQSVDEHQRLDPRELLAQARGEREGINLETTVANGRKSFQPRMDAD